MSTGATGDALAQPPALSVVVPTRNEAGNIAPLLARIRDACSETPTEVVFVDDSTDETPSVIERLAARSSTDVLSGDTPPAGAPPAGQTSLSITLIHRPPERRGSGLGGAVVEGIRAARGEWVCVLDADLQHPPERIPDLLDRAAETGAELVVASRYAASGDAARLGLARHLVSRSLTWAGRALYPRRLSRTTDPLTGFFLLRRQAVDFDRLRPRGFKILLEILVRFPELRVAEVPFEFGERYAGQSKASAREVLRYFALLIGLRLSVSLPRFSRFAAVGASGLAVNLLLLALLTDGLGLHYALSTALATQGSSGWNYALIESWVFRDRSAGRLALLRFMQYLLANNGLLILRGPLLLLLTSGLGVHYLVSNLLTLLLLSATRFGLADQWVWARREGDSTARPLHYDVHGIVRLSSDVALPELAYFRTAELLGPPDVTVRVGSPPSIAEEAEGAGPDAARPVRRFRYREALGRLGFWVDIDEGERPTARAAAPVQVVAGSLLAWSPHVLYTNVVEPILRWTFVRKGYALMHGACLAQDGNAVLVTARTDTGKTSTLLRVLARQPLAFLSDDMVILDRNGRCLCYPKPLTISYHTLNALSALDGAARLSRWERLALHVQSRVHSRSGRLLAKLLAVFPLPMATVNAVVQLLVPPPKYHIDRLIPGVRVVADAVVAHRVEIERGPDREAALDPETAQETLLRNCADAYGFPPYEALEPFLAEVDGVDLREREREIIGEALQGCETTLVSSVSRAWWPRVAAIAYAYAGTPTAAPADDAATERLPARAPRQAA